MLRQDRLTPAEARAIVEVLDTGPGGATYLALVEDAAFHVYARGAVDYSP